MFKKAIKGIQAYKLWTRAYDLVTKWGDNVGETVVNGVPVKSPWLSKINWANGIGLAVSALAFFGIIVPEELKEQVGIASAAVTQVVTIILRTWFNNSVTEAPK